MSAGEIDSPCSNVGAQVHMKESLDDCPDSLELCKPAIQDDMKILVVGELSLFNLLTMRLLIVMEADRRVLGDYAESSKQMCCPVCSTPPDIRSCTRARSVLIFMVQVEI